MYCNSHHCWLPCRLELSETTASGLFSSSSEVGRVLEYFSCCRAQVLGSWASVVEALGLSSCGSQALECIGCSSCGTQAQCCCLWALEHRLVGEVHGVSCSMACGIFSRTGMKPMTSALAGRFLSTVPQGKSTVHISFQISVFIFFGYIPRG